MSRHEARVLALQALYEADLARHPADGVLQRHLAELNTPGHAGARNARPADRRAGARLSARAALAD